MPRKTTKAAPASTQTVTLKVDATEAIAAIDIARDRVEHEIRDWNKSIGLGDIVLCRPSVFSPHLVCAAFVTLSRENFAAADYTHEVGVTVLQHGREPYPLAGYLPVFDTDPGAEYAPCAWRK
jgi:hypothetical protein